MCDLDIFMDRLLQLINQRGGRTKLAKKCFVSVNTMYLWAGKQQTRPNLATVIEVLRGLQTTPEELLWLFGLEEQNNV